MRRIVVLAFSIFLTFSAKAQHWDSLQGGLGNVPRVMYADTVDNFLYTGGVFIEVDNKPIRGIARWNGLQWDSLGAGIDPLSLGWPQNTLAITRYNNEIYAGGAFHSAGSVWSAKIAKWDGTHWDSLPIPPFSVNDLNGAIWSLEAINGNLYIGGMFDTVAGFPCKNIAKWDGVSWTSLNFPNLQYGISINAITEYNGDIYVAGAFHNTINDSVSNILKWNGVSWCSVGGGVKGGWTWIESMAVYNGELYVAGAFFQADGNASDNIQKWNGTSWSNVGGGTGGGNGQIHKLLVYNGKLYALGVFDYAGGVPANYFASWDGINWCSVGTTFDNILDAGCVYNDTLYVGGGFRKIDNDSTTRIAKWIGGNFVSACGNTTGINDVESAQITIQLYPNPASDKITIQFDGANTLGEISITDQFAREVRREKLNGEQRLEISVADLAEGMYFFSLDQNGERESSGKFIVRR
ncbi:hypothetical protein BH09BAC5_BH09BAC5_14750 [soil metagenome]